MVEAMEVLDVKNLTYSIGRKRILSGIHLKVYATDTILLQGDNGAGKSTFLKCILNFRHFPASFFWNRNLPSSRPLLSYLGHEPGLYGSLSLEENLRFFHSLQPGYPWVQVEEWVEMCRIERWRMDPVHKLSRGMKQKTALLRAILPRPHLLLLDEPFTGLDEKSIPILSSILEFVNRDVAIIGVIHGSSDSLWKRKLTLEGGILLGEGW